MRRGTWFWALLGLVGLAFGVFLVASGGGANEVPPEQVPIGWSPEEPVPCGAPAERHPASWFEPGDGPCNVHGVVQTVDGAALAGRVVLAVPSRSPRRSDPDRVWAFLQAPEAPAAVERAARTDEGGRFVFRGLPADRGYRFRADCGDGWTSTVVACFRSEVRKGAFARLMVGPAAPLEGRVVDRDGHGVRAYVTFALPRDELTLEGGPSWFARDVPTDAEGRFAVPAAPPGKLHAWILRVGDRAEPLPIPAEARTRPLELRLGSGATASVEGRLRSHAGAPRVGAAVYLGILVGGARGREHRFLARTDEAGRWRLEGLPAGRIHGAYYVGPAGQGILAELEGRTIAPAQRLSCDLTLPPPITVSGTVRTEDGRPLPGAALRLVQDGLDDYVAARGVTDAQGGYRLTCAAAGYVLLQAGAPGLGLSPAEVGDDAERMLYGLLAGAAVRIAAGSEARTVVRDLTLHPLRALAGRVLDASQRPVAGALLYFEDTRDAAVLGAEALRDVRTDADGHFRALLPLGHRSASARAVFRDTASDAWKIPEEADAREHPTLVLQPTSLLMGRVRGPRGEGLEGLLVRIRALDQRVATGPDGRFTIAGVPPGAHEVTVGTWRTSLRRGGKRLTVTTPAAGDLQVLWTSVGQFVGQVVDRAGHAAADLVVEAWPEGTGETWDHRTRTDAEGWFRLPWLEPVPHLVRLDGRLLDAPCRPGPEIRRWVLPGGLPSVELRGTLLDPRGMPALGGRVEAFRAGDVQGESLDRDFVQEYAPGRFDVRIPHDAARVTLVVTHTVSADGQHDAAPRHVVEDVDPRAPDLVVRLTAGRVLRGRVVTKDGRGVADARVVLRSAEDSRRERWHLEGHEARTDAEGRFAIPGLGAGAVVLDVHPAAPYVPLLGVTFASVEQAIAMSVTEGRPVRGVVVDPRGAAVEGALVEVFASGARRPRRGEALAEAVSDADGGYQIPALGTGPFRVRVGPSPQHRKDWPHPVLQLEGLHAPGLRRLQIPAGHRLEVEFVGPAGEALSPWHASLVPRGGRARSIDLKPVAKGDKRYTSPLIPPGWYDLVVFAADGYLGTVRRRLHVPCEPQRITLGRAWVLAGRIHHGRARDFEVVFFGTHRGEEVRAYDPVRPDGTFSLDLEAPATGALLARARDSDLYAWVPALQPPRKDLVLKPVMGASIRGRIEAPEAGRADIQAIHASGMAIRGKVESDGTFAIRALPPGRYTLELWHPDWEGPHFVKLVPSGARDVVVK